jgi:hypothetical protein
VVDGRADRVIRAHGISARVGVALTSGVIRGGPTLVRMGNTKQIALL